MMKMQEEKEYRFFKIFCKRKNISEETVWSFHHQKTNDLENGITIKRQNTIQTISTTQVIISDEIILKHQDRLNTHSKPEKILLKNEFKTSLS